MDYQSTINDMISMKIIKYVFWNRWKILPRHYEKKSTRTKSPPFNFPPQAHTLVFVFLRRYSISFSHLRPSSSLRVCLYGLWKLAFRQSFTSVSIVSLVTLTGASSPAFSAFLWSGTDSSAGFLFQRLGFFTRKLESVQPFRKEAFSF